MNCLEVLSNEHGLIRQYLENLNLAAEKLEEGLRPPVEFFAKAVEFSRTFTDKFHHFKEEHVLFVRLAEKKKGAIDAKLDALRYQHERGRSAVAGIDESLEGYAREDSISTTRLIEYISSYISLLRHHIHIEDHVFYPMAKEEISAEEETLIIREFEKAREKTGERAFEEAHKLVVDMGSMLVHM